MIIYSACSTGTYASQSNGSCLPCPRNSFSNVPGGTQCTCISGYCRLTSGPGGEDLPCSIMCMFEVAVYSAIVSRYVKYTVQMLDYKLNQM